MKANLLEPISILASCAVLCSDAFAQSATQQTHVASPLPAMAAATAKPPGVANAAPKAAEPALLKISAAGSVIVLSHGVVSSATIAQILPPAPGFVYER